MASHFSPSGIGKPTLDVAAGVHRGVSVPMDADVCRIGSGGTDDLVLSDSGVEAGHMRLRFSGSQVSVEALKGDVRVLVGGRETRVARGHGYRAALPLDLEIGQARLTLTAPESEKRTVAPVWYGKPQWLIAGVFMFICAGALAMLRETPTTERASFIEEQSAVEVAAKPAPATVEEARADLALRASRAGLKSLNIFAIDGQLTARGTLTPEQRSKWVSLQQYFDGHYGRRFVLHSNEVAVRAPGAQPKVHFQAVWFGDNPYVVDSSGTRLMPGSPVSDGWTIKSIEDEVVELARGDETFFFTLGATPADEG